MALKITLELTSSAQLDAIATALETHIEIETERSKDKDSGWDQRAAASLEGARQVLWMLLPTTRTPSK